MRTYENLLLPVDEWYVTSVLNLAADGRFRYEETWSCYAGSVSAGAEGKWRETQGVVILETESIEGGLRLGLEAGRQFQAIERGGSLDFGGDFVMRRRDE